MEWDELRFFHAVAMSGSLSKAASALCVSQPTVGRRIKALENRLDARLFDRLISGYVLTDVGMRIFEKTGHMANIARGIEDCAAGERSLVAGTVLLTAPEGIGSTWLARKLLGLTDAHPDLDLKVSLSNRISDVSNGEADAALRLGDPFDETLIGRRIAMVAFRLFASKCYLERHGIPKDLTEIRHHRIIESGGVIRDVSQAKRLRQVACEARVAATLDNLHAQAEAVRAGLGIAALPPYFTDTMDGLIPILPNAFVVEVPLWFLTRQHLRTSGGVGAVKTFLTAAARAESWVATSIARPVRAAAVAPIRQTTKY